MRLFRESAKRRSWAVIHSSLTDPAYTSLFLIVENFLPHAQDDHRKEFCQTGNACLSVTMVLFIIQNRSRDTLAILTQ